VADSGVLLPISIAIYLSLSYTVALFLVSRRRRPPSLPAPTNLLFVFVLPCLNEELVIGQSLERLLSMPGNFVVLVIDDGSEDATADVVRSAADERVHLLRRVPPNARNGKGRALNCAYQYLLHSDMLDGRFDEVVLVVLDADGRVALNALTEVAPYFRDPKVGGVQIGVRMFNARSTLLARIQDFEFIAYNEIFQRGRQRLGSVGLGGNGQFTRLSALRTLGEEPWSDFLTEDLDLGIRLLLNGWHNSFCPTTYVSQQALTRIRPLVRQRTRWFQGHLQTWRRIPMILRSGLPTRTMLDLVNLVLQPGLLLAISLVPPAVISILLIALASEPSGLAHALVDHWGINILCLYLLTFGLAPFYAFTFWLHEESISFPRALVYAYIYTLYSYMWFIAGWRAVGRILTGRSSWAKTARIPETQPAISSTPVPTAAKDPTAPSMIDVTAISASAERFSADR
jgi:cellulose synthase/poly-beta-1,6-N-acetylglucosamine synthase-like glycosyltransferase